MKPDMVSHDQARAALPDKIQNLDELVLPPGSSVADRRQVPLPALLAGDTVAEFVAPLYPRIGPELGAHLTDSNVVLTVAGLKGDTEFFVENISSRDDASRIQGAAEEANRYFRERDVPLSLHVVGEPFQPQVGRSCLMVGMDNHLGIELATKFSRFVGLPIYDKTTGETGLREWHQAFVVWSREIASRYTTDTRTQMEIESNLLSGVVKGYPDIAVIGFTKLLLSGRKLELHDTRIIGTGTYKEAQPNFGYLPENVSDPALRHTIELSGIILSEFYASNWHRAIAQNEEFMRHRKLGKTY